MNNRLQVGGLALIIHSSHDENIGRQVRLVGFVGSFQGIDNGDHWEINASQLSGIRNGVKVKSDYTYHPAKWLMPLGDKQTQDELAKEREIENA